jgi:hypothetical protein
MSEVTRVREPLRWSGLVRDDGIRIEQARARNNSWYLIVPDGDGFELRYASQSANSVVIREASVEAARAAADVHADRYDTRA